MKIKEKKCRNKECFKMFMPYLSTQVVCSTACAVKYAEQKREADEQKEWNKEKAALKEKLKTWQDYYQEALNVFNAFIRYRDRNERCISCDKLPGTFRKSSGHYYPQGQFKSVALDPDNAHVQCWYDCNKNKHGNLAAYQPRLIEKIGQDRWEALQKKAQTPYKYTIPELIERKAYFKEQLRLLKSQSQ